MHKEIALFCCILSKFYFGFLTAGYDPNVTVAKGYSLFISLKLAISHIVRKMP